LADDAAQLAARAGLAVDEVLVEGRANTPLELVRAALDVERGDPILGVSLTAARERLQALPWVESAHLERRLPGTLLVRLTERRPFAIWQHEGQFFLVDRAGVVIPTERLDAHGNLPLVVGAGAARHAAAMLDLLAGYPAVRDRTQALVRVADRRWNLRLASGADALLPEGAEEAALRRLDELHRAHALLDRPLAVLDLRLPDRLVLRPAPAAEPAATTPAARERGSRRG
ncbi:MAG: FtsQ-type POTRA domain-containing protein, partial [Acetobacteraceae bacterium]|nr:FtsQ-type POTRA domain-containing protein [Acetobacteraceae bacterium]